MAIYNAGKAKSILDQANQGILGDDSAQASQPAYQNAYQAVMGQTPDIAGTPDWYQRQRLAFYKPTDIDTNAVDLFSSTSAQAEDWRKQGAEGYQQFAKQYGTNTPWLFRSMSEGGFGLDPTKYNLIADPTKAYRFQGDVGSDPYMSARYGGFDAQSAYLDGTFNPLTGEQGASFDMFYQYKPGPAQDKGRSFFGSLLGGATPMGQAFNTAKSGIFGSGVARTAEGMERSMPGYQQQQRAYDKLYGYVPQAGKSAMTSLGGVQQKAQTGMSNMAGFVGSSPTQQFNTAYDAASAYGQQRQQQAQERNIQLQRGGSYATRFMNPYRRNPYEY